MLYINFKHVSNPGFFYAKLHLFNDICVVSISDNFEQF